MSVLSKIKLGNTTYDLKDADSRTKLSTLIGTHAVQVLGAAAWEGVDQEVTGSAAGLPTTGAVKNYVDAQIGTINKFDVRIYEGDSEGKPNVVASAQTMYILALVADAQAASGSYIEWITIRNGQPDAYTYAWEQIGSTQADLGDYLKKTATVAGVAFGNDSAISVAELEAAGALDLKALAHKANATGSTTLDTIDSISMKNLTVAGNAAVTHTSANATLTTGDYTPAGTVAVTLNNNTVVGSATQGTLPSKQEDTFSAGALPTFTEGAFSAGSLPSFTEGAFTANVPTAIDVTKFNGGAAATWTGAAHTAASLGNATKAQFAQEGLVGEVGTGDDAETLILTAATKANAVTEQGTFTPDTVDFGTFDGGSAASLASGFYSAGTAASKAADTFSAGSLPSKAADTFTQGALPSYTEGEFDAGSLPTFTNATVGVASASFTGTEAEDILVTAVAYDKADATAAFSETVTPEVNNLAKTAKTIEITVS